MNENELHQNLELYRAQLAQVEQAMAAAGRTHELQTLISDLKELISLTEGSLLSLKKSQLLKSLEDSHKVEADDVAFQSGSQSESQCALPASQSAVTAQHSSIDDEYAAFQAALLEADNTNLNPEPGNSNRDVTPSPSLQYNLQNSASYDCASSARGGIETSSSDSSDSEAESDGAKKDNLLEEELSKLVGMKCCAPFSHDWGSLDYHNAMVLSAERETNSDNIKVTVMFTTPTHNAMRPCQYFLSGRCKFNQDMCKYSHGHTVLLQELRPFVEADHSTVRVDTKVLACYSDSIWYRATVTDVQDETVSVLFEDYDQHMELDMSQVVPTTQHAVGNDSSEEDENEQPSTSTVQGKQPMPDEDKYEEEELPTFLWKSPQTTSALGEWEAHTKGFGSRLMQKMGYVVGQGLGVRGQGKAEPVPIMLLPQGKSLDRIMELKAMAGGDDAFDVVKRLERRQKMADRKQENAANKPGSGHNSVPTSSKNVFDFINNKLGGRKGNLSSLCKLTEDNPGGLAGKGDNRGAEGRKNITEHELHKKTDKDINLQVFKTDQEMRNVQRQIQRLRQQLERNENKDRKMADQARDQLAQQEAYLERLQVSSSALHKHQTKRKDSKKLAIF